MSLPINVKLYPRHKNDPDDVTVTEALIFILIKKNPEQYHKYFHLIDQIENYDLKAVLTNHECFNYVVQDIKLCLQFLDSLNPVDLIDGPRSEYIISKKLINIVNFTNMKDLLSKLVQKQEILDLMSGKNDLEKILTTLSGNFKRLSGLSSDERTSMIDHTFVEIWVNLAPNGDYRGK